MFLNQTFIRRKYHLYLIGFILAASSCHTPRNTIKSNNATVNHQKINYDDSLLTQINSPYLLPYNRIIDGAGTFLSFGSSELENHSLDAVLMPDKKTLVVEDRYGIAFVSVIQKKLIYRFAYDANDSIKGAMSVYSGIKVYMINERPHIFWSAANANKKKSFVLEADWDGKKSILINTYQFAAASPAPLALANDIALQNENKEAYMYVVLNGNSQLVKMRLRDKKIIWQTNTGMAPYGIAVANKKAYVTNWAGSVPTDTAKETAGIPYAKAYINPSTGAASSGTVSVIDMATGKLLTEIKTGHHPNAIIANKNESVAYVANGNSDNISVINTETNKVTDIIPVKLNGAGDGFLGDSPDALALSENDSILYVANGLDNAIAVVSLSKNSSQRNTIKGFIPTQAYPGGIVVNGNELYVTNLEGIGARVKKNNAFNSHKQEATVSFIAMPDKKKLVEYTEKVQQLNLQFRNKMAQLLPRKNKAPVPVPERIGEPSSIKHVVYIIKENRTYDQVLGDMQEGRGKKELCVFGDIVTPNQHALAKQFGLLDNYYVSGKSSAEGHQWADAAMVTDYVEKNVRAWFRSYPHVQQDALVYSDAGFIWNNALDHGKTVRVYGEACEPAFNQNLTWTDIYNLYLNNQPFAFTNTTTISRVAPVLSKLYPGYDNHKINDQIRASAFIKEWKQYEQSAVDSLPGLLIIALPADHTSGLRPGFPTPRAAVADNDLALGRIVETITRSRFWDSTAIFVTEDDSQDGWDHVSAYRTTGFIISPYSSQKTIHTNYNQTCMVRTIEQILGIPPMNKIDATATPMFACFAPAKQASAFTVLPNAIPLNEMNKEISLLKGKEKKFAELSMQKQFDHIDGGNDDLMNRIIWYATMGDKAYPVKMTARIKDND